MILRTITEPKPKPIIGSAYSPGHKLFRNEATGEFWCANDPHPSDDACRVQRALLVWPIRATKL